MAEKLARGSGGAPTKNMVLRLDLDLAERLAGIAEVEGRSVSDVAREAIAALVEARRKDKRFHQAAGGQPGPSPAPARPAAR